MVILIHDSAGKNWKLLQITSFPTNRAKLLKHKICQTNFSSGKTILFYKY